MGEQDHTYKEIRDRIDPPEEQVAEQHSLAFLGETLIIAATAERQCYVSIPSVCSALRLNSKGQIQRLKRLPLLRQGLRLLALETRGGAQGTYCLHVEWLDYWLGSIRQKGVQTPTETIERYREALPGAVYGAFGAASSLPGTSQLASAEPAPQATIVPAEAVEAPAEDPQLSEKLTMLTSIPAPTLTERFTATDSQVDRTMREATLAREEQWETEEETAIFSGSTNLQIYLGTPFSPLDLSEAQEQIRQLGASTVLTARVVMGLWNLRRNDSRLSINGSAAIHIDEIFAWRGLQKHRRAAYPGASQKRTDGYRHEQKQQVLQDLALLASCCVRGHCTVSVRGRRKTFYINGPYLRYSVVTTPTIWGEEEIVGFFLSPGDWITTYEAHDQDVLVEIDRRIFLLNPHNEQHELRLALYLVELWRQQAREGHYQQPITMHDLLTASMIPIDKVNIARFATRIETALDALWTRGILGGSRPAPLAPVDRHKARWGSDWLNAEWILVPPFGAPEATVPPARPHRRLQPPEARPTLRQRRAPE